MTDKQPLHNDIKDIETKVICPVCGRWFGEGAPELRSGICRDCRSRYQSRIDNTKK